MPICLLSGYSHNQAGQRVDDNATGHVKYNHAVDELWPLSTSIAITVAVMAAAAASCGRVITEEQEERDER